MSGAGEGEGRNDENNGNGERAMHEHSTLETASRSECFRNMRHPIGPDSASAEVSFCERRDPRSRVAPFALGREVPTREAAATSAWNGRCFCGPSRVWRLTSWRTGLARVLSVGSILLAAIAYWRSGGREELELLRAKQKLMVDELERRIHGGLEETRTRTLRAEQRLTDLKRDTTANVQQAIDALSRETAQITKETEERLQDLRFEVTVGAQAAEQALARRMRRVEGSLRILAARAEIGAAERLADAGELADAEDLLEDAVAKVREAKMRLADDDDGEERNFDSVISALHEAIVAVRERALDHKREIDSVLSASDSLLASLRAREAMT
jgi:hypothetical protein